MFLSQIRFDAECRAAGLLDNSEDESDEEIKELKDQIRQKRQRKLGIGGTGETAVQSENVAAAATAFHASASE